MDIIEMLKEFIRPELLVLVPVLYAVGAGLKTAQTFPDKYIPVALGAGGVVLSALWVVATTPIAGMQDVAMAVFTAIVQGVLVAGGAVYANQVKKQAQEK